MRRLRRQRGFTLTELAFGGLIATGLSVVALELLLTSANVKMELDSQLRVNRAARQSLSIVAEGGVDGGSTALGARARAGPPPVVLVDGEVLQMTSTGGTVTGDRNTPVTVTCVATGEPLPACTGPGTTVVVDGHLAAQPAFQDQARSVTDRTVETEILVRDPWAATRGHGRVERYGTIHIYNADEGQGTPGAATDQIGG